VKRAFSNPIRCGSLRWSLKITSTFWGDRWPSQIPVHGTAPIRGQRNWWERGWNAKPRIVSVPAIPCALVRPAVSSRNPTGIPPRPGFPMIGRIFLFYVGRRTRIYTHASPQGAGPWEGSGTAERPCVSAMPRHALWPPYDPPTCYVGDSIAIASGWQHRVLSRSSWESPFENKETCRDGQRCGAVAEQPMFTRTPGDQRQAGTFLACHLS